MSIKYTTIPSKRLAESITSSATTFQLSDIEAFDGSDLTTASFGTTSYGVFRSAQNSIMELFEFDPSTIATGILTFTRRGLSFTGDLTTETSALKLNWVKGTTIVELGAPSPQVFQYLKEYIDNIAISGSPDASDTAKGIVEMATQAETDAGTQSGGTGARLVVDPSRVRAKAYHDYAADAGSTDAYAITITPAITAYATGQVFTFKANTANTGPATLNVSGLGAKSIVKNYNTALSTGDILANQIVTVVYDGTNMQMLSVPSPSNSVIATIVRNCGQTSKNLADATAATTVIAHGLGVAPTIVRAIGVISSATVLVRSEGVFTNGVYSELDLYSDSAGNQPVGSSTSFILKLYGPTQGTSAFQTATVTVDATNITLTWTKTSSPTGTVAISWEAEGYTTDSVAG